VATLESEAGATKGQQEGAAAGHAVLVAYAPSDSDTDRLMSLARCIGYQRAQKYDRVTVSDL
jgi:hypothetical protein